MKLNCSINEWPGTISGLVYALQWFLVGVPFVIILGKTAAMLHYPQDLSAQQMYLQRMCLCSGIAMLGQLWFGHRLPIVVAPASVLLLGVVSSPPATSPEAIYTASAVGAVFMLVLGWTGLASRVGKLFGLRVVAAVLLLIAVTMSPTIWHLLTMDTLEVAKQLSLVAFLLLIQFGCQRRIEPLWRSVLMIAVMVAGSFSWYFLLGGGWPQLTAKSVATDFLKPIHPVWDTGLVLAFLFCHFALLINEISSVRAISTLVVPEAVPPVRRGVVTESGGNLLAGFLGVLGNVSYSLSPGLIATTGCASRFPMMLAAVAVAFLSLFPWIIALFSAIPSAMIGMMMIYLMVNQVGSAFSLIQPALKENRQDTVWVLGVAVLVGVLLTLLPAEQLNHIPLLLRPLCGNSFVMGVVAAIIAEQICRHKGGISR